jgi:hypothetical protein
VKKKRMIYLYFFIGQAVAYNFAHFAVSLVFLVGCHIIQWLASDIGELYQGLAFYAGLLSVFLVPELFLQVQDIITRIIHLRKYFNFTFYILILELLLFVAITIFIVDFEFSTTYWVYLLIVHTLYNFMLSFFGSTLPLYSDDKTQIRKYYVSWFYLILLTDLVFLVVSLIEINSLSTHIIVMYIYAFILVIFQVIIKILEKLSKQ